MRRGQEEKNRLRLRSFRPIQRRGRLARRAHQGPEGPLCLWQPNLKTAEPEIVPTFQTAAPLISNSRFVLDVNTSPRTHMFPFPAVVEVFCGVNGND